MGGSRIPEGIKRRLIPAWNWGVHASWRARAHAWALLRGRFGRCSVCGRFSPWLEEPRAIPSRLVELWGLTPALRAALVRKETSNCACCGAKSRARRLASVILETFPTDRPRCRSLAEWAREPVARSLRVAEINRIDGIHETLAALPEFASSDFIPGAPPGAVVDGVRSEDLCRLTYPDGAFDLVLTSETLEHVPDLDAALAEIRRVLRPGGVHIFTLPRLPGVDNTFARMTLHPDGSLERHAPEIRHPGGDVGYPVFTEFGADLEQRLRAAGFATTTHFGPTREDDLAQVYVSMDWPSSVKKEADS